LKLEAHEEVSLHKQLAQSNVREMKVSTNI